MRRMFTVLTAAFALVAFTSLASAHTPSQAGTAAKAAKPAAEKVVKPAAAKPVQAEKSTKKEMKKSAATARGEVEKYDSAARTLTVKTKKGPETFAVTGDTKITAGAKAGNESELVAGKNVIVHYTEANGQMTATQVSIAAEHAMAKKAPKK